MDKIIDYKRDRQTNIKEFSKTVQFRPVSFERYLEDLFSFLWKSIATI